MNDRRRFIIAASTLTGVASLTGRLAAQTSPAATEEKEPAQVDAKLIGKFVAKSHGDIETIKELLKSEPNLIHASWDWGGGDFETGLNAASHVGRRDIAEFLLERGARLDVPAAVMLGMTEVVREMMKVQPKLHQVGGAHDIPLLSHAILGKEPADDIVEMLISAGADVNASSRIGMTPLMAAASIGRGEHVEMLLTKGAKIQSQDSRGRTALDFAKKRKHDTVVKLLEQAVKTAESL